MTWHCYPAGWWLNYNPCSEPTRANAESSCKFSPSLPIYRAQATSAYVHACFSRARACHERSRVLKPSHSFPLCPPLPQRARACWGNYSLRPTLFKTSSSRSVPPPCEALEPNLGLHVLSEHRRAEQPHCRAHLHAGRPPLVFLLHMEYLQRWSFEPLKLPHPLDCNAGLRAC